MFPTVRRRPLLASLSSHVVQRIRSDEQFASFAKDHHVMVTMGAYHANNPTIHRLSRSWWFGFRHVVERFSDETLQEHFEHLLDRLGVRSSVLICDLEHETVDEWIGRASLLEHIQVMTFRRRVVELIESQELIELVSAME